MKRPVKRRSAKMLPREEWDFRAPLLANAEVPACHVYERARMLQSKAWYEWILEWRTKSKQNNFDAHLERARGCEERGEEWPFLFYSLWPGWPHEPFLQVPEAERQRRLRVATWGLPTDAAFPISTEPLENLITWLGAAHFRHSLTPAMASSFFNPNYSTGMHRFIANAIVGETIQFKDDLGLPLEWRPAEQLALEVSMHEYWAKNISPESTPALPTPERHAEPVFLGVGESCTEASKKPSREIVAFKMEYAASDEEILAAIKSWLEIRREELGLPSPPPPETRGAAARIRRWRADLKALGVWRLADAGLNRRQIVTHTQRFTGKPLLSDHPSALSQELKRARDILNTFGVPEMWGRLHPKG